MLAFFHPATVKDLAILCFERCIPTDIGRLYDFCAP